MVSSDHMNITCCGCGSVVDYEEATRAGKRKGLFCGDCATKISVRECIRRVESRIDFLSKIQETGLQSESNTELMGWLQDYITLLKEKYLC